MKRPPKATTTPAVPKVRSVRYDDIEDSLATGDVLLFHGASGVSLPIESKTHSPFSHAAMVIRPDRGQPPLVWQADPIPLTKDAVTRSMHKGAQISLLRENLIFVTNPKYGDTPYLRRLNFRRSPEFEVVAMWAIAGLDGTPFPKLQAMLTEWTLGASKHIATTDRTFFCAELVAHTFMLMGLLPFDPPANAYAPGAFGAPSERGPWLRGASLGPILSLIPPPAPAPPTKARHA
jgi:hypothetical protein